MSVRLYNAVILVLPTLIMILGSHHEAEKTRQEPQPAAPVIVKPAVPAAYANCAYVNEMRRKEGWNEFPCPVEQSK